MPQKQLRLIGYMRVSRSRQNVARQRVAFTAAKCCKIFCDKISGKRWNRVGLDAALAMIRPGDKLAVEAIDRLGRSALEILTIIEELHARGASLISLSQHCDSAVRTDRAQILFLAMFAEIEHDFITYRTQSGVDVAAAAGRHRGGKPKMSAKQVAKAATLMTRLPANEVAARFRVGRSTLFRHLKASRSQPAHT